MIHKCEGAKGVLSVPIKSSEFRSPKASEIQIKFIYWVNSFDANAIRAWWPNELVAVQQYDLQVELGPVRSANFVQSKLCPICREKSQDLRVLGVSNKNP